MASTNQNIDGDNMDKVIIALAFGQGRPDENGRPTPGKSNEALAKIVAELDEKYNLPIIAQWKTPTVFPSA